MAEGEYPPHIYELARSRNFGREPDGLHLVYETELARLRAENDGLRAAAALNDPLAGLPQSPLNPSPLTDEEERRRKHLAPFIFDLLDRTRPAGVRENALRHLVVCDPARAIGALATLAANGIQALEETWGDPAGTVVTLMRADLAANS